MKLSSWSRIVTVAFVGAFAFSAALAAVDLSIANNTQVESRLLDGASVHRYRVFLPAGAKLSAAVKGKKDKQTKAPAPPMRLRLLDEFEDDIIADGFLDKAKLKEKGTGAKAKATIEDTGEYILEVFSDDGSIGTFTLSVKWSSPRAFKIKDEVFEGFGTDVEVSVDEDAQLTMAVKKSGRSTAKPYFDLIEGDEFDQELDNAPKLKKITVLEGGDLFVVIGNDVGEGRVAGSVKVKPPKAKKSKVPIEPVREGTEEKKVTGGVVVPSKDVLIEADDEDIVGDDIVGASVLVPAGAVTQPTSVQIGTADPLLAPSPDVGIGAGPTVSFGPAGIEFQSPVTVTIPFDADSLEDGDTTPLSVYTEDEDGNVSEIEDFDVDVDDETVSFQVSHFSTFRVFVSGVTPGTSDLDGDGVDDLILPAPAAADGAGRVYIFSGVPDFDADTSEADYTIQGAVSQEALGEAFAVGDVTGDGQADLLLIGQGVNDGTCFVFAGGGAFGPTSSSAATFRLDGAVGFGGMGTVAVGDVNDDGVADIAIGGEDGPTGEGSVVVFFGGQELRSETTTAADLTFTGEQVGDLFGAAVAIGDVNGDAKPDLAIGADMIDNPGRAGGVYVQFGGTNIASRDAEDMDVVIDGSTADAGFGLNIAIGDVTGDGNGDLIASEFDDDLGGDGAVFIFNGGTTFAPSSTADASMTLLGGQDAVLGSSLVLVDVDDDDVLNVILGARGAADADGGLYVVSTSLATSGLPAVFATPHVSGPGFFEGFPILSPGIRSGASPVVIAFAPGNEDGEIGGGSAYLFFGDPRDLPLFATTDDADITIFGQEDDVLGGEVF